MTDHTQKAIEAKPDFDRLIKLVEELVYYSQLHTVKGVTPANMQTHDESWREAQKWLWDNCYISEGEYFLRSKALEEKDKEIERITNLFEKFYKDVTSNMFGVAQQGRIIEQNWQQFKTENNL